MTNKTDSRPWAFASEQWIAFKAELERANVTLAQVNAFYSDEAKGSTLTVRGHDCMICRVFCGGDYAGLLFVMGHGPHGFTPYLELRSGRIPDLVREICERVPAG